MKQYCLKITSKNKKSLENFLHFFSNHLSTEFSIIQKLIVSHNNKKKITLLKSPHVNKKAQEHFESKVFTIKLHVSGVGLKRNLIFLKKIWGKLFQDIRVQLKFIIVSNIKKIYKLLILSFDNFKLSLNKKLKLNLTRSQHKAISKKFKLKKNSSSNLAEFLYITSAFGETTVRSFLKQ